MIKEIYESYEDRERKDQEKVGFRWFTEKVWYPGCFGISKQKKTTVLQYFDKDNKVWNKLPTEYNSIFVD